MFDIDQDLIKLAISLALGAAIGLEREVSDKAAGLRTNILIALGSTLFSIVSLRLVSVSDPARIAAQVVTGIGFIGAGAIMREGDRVTGLTTAATIWTVAAIGMAVGFGYYAVACATTVLALIVQLGFTYLDILIDDIRERHTFKVITPLDERVIEGISRIFRESRVKVMRRKIMKVDQNYHTEWFTSGPRKSMEKVIKKLIDSPDVKEVIY